MADHVVTRIAVTFDLLDQPFKVPRELGSRQLCCTAGLITHRQSSERSNPGLCEMTKHPQSHHGVLSHMRVAKKSEAPRLDWGDPLVVRPTKDLFSTSWKEIFSSFEEYRDAEILLAVSILPGNVTFGHDF
jgi:hypothetical protein